MTQSRKNSEKTKPINDIGIDIIITSLWHPHTKRCCLLNTQETPRNKNKSSCQTPPPTFHQVLPSINIQNNLLQPARVYSLPQLRYKWILLYSFTVSLFSSRRSTWVSNARPHSHAHEFAFQSFAHSPDNLIRILIRHSSACKWMQSKCCSSRGFTFINMYLQIRLMWCHMVTNTE